MLYIRDSLIQNDKQGDFESIKYYNYYIKYLSRLYLIVIIFRVYLKILLLIFYFLCSNSFYFSDFKILNYFFGCLKILHSF